eukprot:76559_1
MIYKLIKKWEPDLDYKSIYKCLMNYEFGIEEHKFTQLKHILEKKLYHKTMLINDLCNKNDDTKSFLYNILTNELNFSENSMKQFCDILLYKYIKYDELQQVLSKEEMTTIDRENWYRNAIDYDKLCDILKECNVDIDQKEFESQITEQFYGYYNHDKLITNVCDGLNNETDDNILMSEILKTQFYFNSCKRKLFYNIILHKCINIKELNNNNFLKILNISHFYIQSPPPCRIMHFCKGVEI